MEVYKNVESRKTLENAYGVELMDIEWQILQDKWSERKMYCENFVDSKWEKTMERRKRDHYCLETIMREMAVKEQIELEATGELSC